MGGADGTAEQLDGNPNDSEYQKYLRDFEQSQSKQREKSKKSGKAMTYNEWLVKNEDAPEQLSKDEGRGTDTKPATVKSASGEGVKKIGDSGVELRAEFDTPTPAIPRSSHSRPIDLEDDPDYGMSDPDFKKYRQNFSDSDQQPLNYDDWMDEQMQKEEAAQNDVGYQKYLADHASKAEQAKKDGKKNIGPPKSHAEYLDEQAGLENPEYQKYLDNKEATNQQAKAQGLDIGDGENPLSYKDWQDEKAGQADNNYQNYKKNLKPNEQAKKYSDWKKNQGADQNQKAEENQTPPTVDEQKPPEETTAPPEVPPKEEIPTPTPEEKQPPVLDEAGQGEAGSDLQTPADQGTSQSPTAENADQGEKTTGGEPKKAEGGEAESASAALSQERAAKSAQAKASSEDTDSSFGDISSMLSWHGLASLCRFMPGSGALIKNSLGQIVGKKGNEEAELKVCNFLLARLKEIKILAIIIDASIGFGKVWGEMESSGVWWIVELCLIGLIIDLLIWFGFLVKCIFFPGTITKIVNKIIASVEKVKKVLEKKVAIERAKKRKQQIEAQLNQGSFATQAKGTDNMNNMDTQLEKPAENNRNLGGKF